METVLIRHGHAEHNAAFQAQGERAYFSEDYFDAQLTCQGHTQTRTLTVPQVDRVYVSPLLRCVQTARNIFGKHRMLYLHDGLMETQGLHPVNRRRQKSELRQHEHVDLTHVSEKYEFVAETPEQLKDRAQKTLADIRGVSGSRRFAIVTHHDWLLECIGESLGNAEVRVVCG